jgi:hypothetical protein
MAKKLIKWVLRVIGCILLVAILFYTYVHFSIQKRMDRKYDVSVTGIKLPVDSMAIIKGNHLVAIKGCFECHGDNLGGRIMADDAMIGTIAAPNLTRAKEDYRVTTVSMTGCLH